MVHAVSLQKQTLETLELLENVGIDILAGWWFTKAISAIQKVRVLQM